MCYNCVDRHIPTKGDEVAIVHEGDEVSSLTPLRVSPPLTINATPTPQRLGRKTEAFQSHGSAFGPCAHVFAP